MNRRTFLSVATVTALAGCSDSPTSGGSGGSSSGGGSGDGDGGPNPAAARRDIDTQPTLGPDPGDASGLIVAFEDPSCTRCRAFEQNIVPQIRSKLVEPGKATFVFRGYPVVYPWGEPATHALEATYARDEAAFWSLAAHYFENQGSFGGSSAEDVYAETRSFLANETDLDAAAVVSDAQGEAARTAVQTDLDAGKEAGAGRTTPHIFLFRDGEYQTKAAGSVSYDTIEAVLQV